MAVSQGLPCPFMNVVDILDIAHHKIVAPTIQSGQTGFPHTVNAILTRELTIVVERGVQGHMGIRHIMPKVGGMPQNGRTIQAVKSLNKLCIRPTDLPRQNPIFPQGILATGLSRPTKPRRIAQTVRKFESKDCTNPRSSMNVSTNKLFIISRARIMSWIDHFNACLCRRSSTKP